MTSVLAQVLTVVLTSIVIVTSAATKIDRSYCNTAMNTGIIPPLPIAATLVQVHVLHRHGSRTKGGVDQQEAWLGESKVMYNCTSELLEGPDATVSPSGAVLFNKVYEPGRNELNGNCMTGQLVADGLLMCQASGRNLAKAYKNFLPSTPLDPADFYLRSDDVPRTLASGQGLFAAMYPDHEAVVPWHTMDVGSDAETMVPNPKVCPSLIDAASRALTHFEASEHYQHVSIPLASELSTALNRTITPNEIAGLLDPLMSVQCSTVPSIGGDPPAALNKNLQDRMIEESGYKLYYACNDTDVAKFGAGPLLGEILVKMEVVNAKEIRAPKLVIWSGHDTGPMAPVIGALRVGGAEFPRFNELLAIEMYDTSSSGTMIRIIHNGAVVTGLVPGCPQNSDLCPWKLFHDTVMRLVPTPSDCGREDSPAWWPVPTLQE